MIKKVYIITAVIFVCTVLSAQEKQKISIEWIYSRGPSEITRLPNYAWTENGDAIIYDSKKSENQFYIFDPKTNTEKPVFDSDKALESLKQYLGDDTPKNLRMPQSFDKSGKQALYNFNDDIFLLNLSTNEFTRVTDTKEEEKDAKFSPDGNISLIQIKKKR